MRRNDRISGTLVQYDEPVWGPLLSAIGEELTGWFMWMHELELSDGTRVHAYKHQMTRRYLHLSDDGRAFEYTGSDDYIACERGDAVQEALEKHVLVASAYEHRDVT